MTMRQPLRAPAPIASRGRAPQRACACGGTRDEECAECKKMAAAVQRRAVAGTPPPAGRVPSIVSDVLRSPGTALDPGVRAVMEGRFRHAGQRLLVHELTHVAQQSGRSVPSSDVATTPVQRVNEAP
jgi:hypothetical protein